MKLDGRDRMRIEAQLLVLLAGIGVVAITGCSNPRQDVRITLCQDLVKTQLESPQSVDWQAIDTELRGHEHLEVGLRFEAQDRSGTRTPMQASCFYDYDAVEDTALTLADPLSAYATSPFRMTLSGRELSRSTLAEAVKRAMMRQGQALIEGVQEGIEQATQEARKRLEEATDR